MKQLLKIGAITGLMGGGLFILFFLILFWSVDNPLGHPARTSDFFVYLVVYVVLYFLYRYQLTFRQGFLLGNVTTFVMMGVSVLFMFIFLNYDKNQVLNQFIKADIHQRAHAHSNKQRIEKLNKEGKDGQKIFNDYIKSLKAWDKGKWMNFVLRKEFSIKVLVGIIISLMLSLVLRKYRPKEPQPEATK